MKGEKLTGLSIKDFWMKMIIIVRMTLAEYEVETPALTQGGKPLQMLLGSTPASISMMLT